MGERIALSHCLNLSFCLLTSLCSPSQALSMMYALASLGWRNSGVWEKAASGALAHRIWDHMGRMSAQQVCVSWCVWMGGSAHECATVVQPVVRALFFLSHA